MAEAFDYYETALDLDAMAEEARARVAEYVNRAAAQHLRAMRKSWGEQ